MKVYAISDLHLPFSANKPMEVFGGQWENYLEKIKADWQEKVEEDDIVLIAGDISWAMKLDEFKQDLNFFDGLKGKIVFIRGNHDYWWSSKTKVNSVLKPNMTILHADAICLNNIIFCGTRGWDLPNFHKTKEDEKIFARELIRLEMALKSAQDKQTNGQKIVLLLHYPPYFPKRKDNQITRLINNYNVDVVVFGHLHGSNYGLNLTEKIDNTTYYLTSCDLLHNKLVEIVL